MLSLLFFPAMGLAITAGYHPVVVAGPFLGQSLEVFNENRFTICNTKGQWKHLWMDVGLGVDDFYCLAQGMTLGEWDKENKVSLPVDNIRVRPFGYAGSPRDQMDGVKSFAGGAILEGEGRLFERLAKFGYSVNDGVFGHTYDWRLGVTDWEKQYFPSFKQIIENAVAKSNGEGAVLTGISMAGQYIHAFLSWVRREHDPEWPSKHIHAFVPVATGFNGAVMALEATLDSALGTYRTDGDCPNCDPPRGQVRRRFAGLNAWFKNMAMMVGDKILTDMMSSFPSTFLVSSGIDHSTTPPTDPQVITIRNAKPAAQCSADPNTATVCGAKKADGYSFDEGFLGQDQCGECKWTNGQCPPGFDRAYDGWTQDLCCKRHQCGPRTYHASEIPELFRELGKEQAAQLMEYSLTVDTTSDPDVPVHCVYSHNVQTFNGINLAANLWDNPKQESLTSSRITMDDGDQTVNHASLEVCDRWASTVKSYRIPGVAHSSMLGVQQVLDVIVAVATEDQATLSSWSPPSYSEVLPKELKVDPKVLVQREKFDVKRLQKLSEY